ncbi:MAG: hypothetical protein QXF12_00200 [Candidatus Aenigmatarchaeota archaeon]
MAIINRAKIPHVVFSYLTSAFMDNSITGAIKKYNKYRYKFSIPLVPILDKSSPFLCTVYLFDGEEAKTPVIEIGKLIKSTGFFIDNSFNEIDVTHNFESSKGGVMTEIKKKVLDTVQSFFKEDPAMAAASISAFKQVPGTMSFLNLFLDADKLSDFSADFTRILANSQLRYPEEHIKVYNGSTIDVPNITVKKYYISFDASNDPYEDLFKDVINLKLLPRLFSPEAFSTVKNMMDDLERALSGADINFDILESDIYQPFVEIASFLYYYTNMAAQAYIAADFTLMSGFLARTVENLKTLFSADKISNGYEEFQYFYKYDESQCTSSRPTNEFNRPSLGYCLVGLCLAPFYSAQSADWDHLGHNVKSNPDAYGGDVLNRPENLVPSGILIAWFFGGLFSINANRKKNIPYYLNIQDNAQQYVSSNNNFYNPVNLGAQATVALLNYAIQSIKTYIYFPQVSTDAILNIYVYDKYTNRLESIGLEKGEYKTYLTNINNSFFSRMGTSKYSNSIESNITINVTELKNKISNFFKLDNDIPECIFSFYDIVYSSLPRFYAISDYLFINANEMIGKVCEDNKSEKVKRFVYDESTPENGVAPALHNLLEEKGPDSYDSNLDELLPIIPLIILGKEKDIYKVQNKEPLKTAMRRSSQLMAYGAFLSYHTTLFKVAGIVQRFYSYAESKEKSPKLLASISSYGDGSGTGREPIGIMPIFTYKEDDNLQKVLSKYYDEIGDNRVDKRKKFEFVMLTLGTVIGGYSLPYDITGWYESVKYEGQNVSMPSYYRYASIFGGLFHETTEDQTFFKKDKIDKSVFFRKTIDLLSQSDLGKEIINNIQEKDLNDIISSRIVINYLKGTMLFIGLLFYYSARNLTIKEAQEEYRKIKEQRDDFFTLYDQKKGILYQAIMNDEQELNKFYTPLLNASVMYSLFASSNKSKIGNIIDEVPWDKAKIGTEEDYNAYNHKLWYKKDDAIIKDKITDYIEKSNNGKGLERLINIAADDSLSVGRFMFFFRPVDNNSIGASCAYAYYVYDCLYYFNIANIFGNKDGRNKIVFMNTRMDTEARKLMNRAKDIDLINTSSEPRPGSECPNVTMFTYMSNLYEQIMDKYLQGGASTTSAGDVETTEGRAGSSNEGIKMKEESGDQFLAKILQMFNVFLTLPPGNYNYVPYFKHLFKALLSGSSSVKINDVTYYISYYMIVLHNISALSNSSTNSQNKGNSRVLAYLVPTNVQIKTSEVYTYPFNYDNESQNKNKARPLYTILSIQFKPIEDLLYIYAAHFSLDEIRRALAISGDDYSGGKSSGRNNPCDQGKANQSEINGPCDEQ